jgi:2-dehydro-3-deoxyphosphogluconate aldolase/(4S)-4-hydroxy-2-oxoglutarate aldolase
MFERLFTHKLMPAVTFKNETDVLPVTEAFLKGGLNVMEVTFRTEIASKAIEMIRKQYPEMKVGAGTLLSAEQISIAINAGALFGVAPGLNTRGAICSRKRVSLLFLVLLRHRNWKMRWRWVARY